MRWRLPAKETSPHRMENNEQPPNRCNLPLEIVWNRRRASSPRPLTIEHGSVRSKYFFFFFFSVLSVFSILCRFEALAELTYTRLPLLTNAPLWVSYLTTNGLFRKSWREEASSATMSSRRASKWRNLTRRRGKLCHTQRMHRGFPSCVPL